jgi:putative transposase
LPPGTASPFFPPGDRLRRWRTVYGWFRRWLDHGLFDALLVEIAKLRRRAAGRRSVPRLAILDTQAVKCIAVRGPRGYDAGKQVLGRKRVALVDADGNWLAVAVVPASVQDRDTPPALNQSLSAWPSWRLAVFDGAFTADDCRAWTNFHGMRHQVVSRAPGQTGFVVLPRRWVVERSFGWLTPWGGLLRERAGRLDVAAGRLAFVAVLSGVQALLNPQPIRKAA